MLVVYAAARAVTTAMMLALAAAQEVNAWTGAGPAYADFAAMWDGNWYHIVAVVGYPAELPLTPEGRVAENAWAFMPAYPLVVRGVMLVAGLSWAPAAVTVSVLFGAGAALLFHRLMAPLIGGPSAMFAVVLFCVAPLSPMMQIAYAESMHAFLLTLALLLLLRRSYGWLFPVVAVMSLTRPSGLAFALALGLHAVYRFVRHGREPFPVRERVLAGSLAVFSAAMGFSWPAMAWAVTGSPTAYTDTELAWRSAYIGYGELVPFASWFQGADWWLGSPLGPILVVALVLAFTAAMFLPAVRRLGADLRIWVASYALYLLAVFFPQSSTFRLLMPLFPLLGAVAQPRSAAYRVAIVAASIALQWGWLLVCWRVAGYDWTPP
ncbi:hypothetical protein ACFDTO_17785 [Microbacteriaceae bacterium 4G12]